MRVGLMCSEKIYLHFKEAKPILENTSLKVKHIIPEYYGSNIYENNEKTMFM